MYKVGFDSSLHGLRSHNVIMNDTALEQKSEAETHISFELSPGFSYT